MILSKRILQNNKIKLIERDEIFTQVPNWNKYFISNWGRLIHKNNKGRYTIVNPSITKGGYLTYTLSKPARKYRGKKVRNKAGSTKTIRECKPTHQMVAIIYVNNPYPIKDYSIKDLEVHHKDKSRTNNYFKNLMWLCKNKNGRTDHDFIHSIKKIALYNNEKATYHTYKDIDLLLNRLDIDVLEFIDTIKYSKTYIKDGKWTTYNVNDYYVGIQYVKNKK
mgnify:CR=1 FL=1